MCRGGVEILGTRAVLFWQFAGSVGQFGVRPRSVQESLVAAMYKIRVISPPVLSSFCSILMLAPGIAVIAANSTYIKTRVSSLGLLANRPEA